MHNIEKSGFRHGQYVGYCNGKVYRIRKCDGGWRATNQADASDSFYAPTLRYLSRMLDAK